MYQRLVAYNKEHGDTNVPIIYITKIPHLVDGYIDNALLTGTTQFKRKTNVS